MKTLVVGDLHGRYDIAKEAIRLACSDDYKVNKVVFLGDYLDSFTESVEDQIKTLLLVTNYARDYPDKVEALMGNHERSYLYPKEACSGWNQETQTWVNAIGIRNIEETLKTYTYVGDFLCTHAGICKGLLEEQGTTLEGYLNSDEHIQVGRSRGGWSGYGGLYWCDFFREFEPIEGVKQIFGHSHYQHSGAIKTNGDNYNLDCLPWSKRDNETAWGLLVEEFTDEVKPFGIL